MHRTVVLGYRVTGHHYAARPARTERHTPGNGYMQTDRIAPAPISRPIPADTAFTPFHWPGTARATTVTNPVLNPTSKVPASPRTAARPVDAEGAGE